MLRRSDTVIIAPERKKMMTEAFPKQVKHINSCFLGDCMQTPCRKDAKESTPRLTVVKLKNRGQKKTLQRARKIMRISFKGQSTNSYI